jgi:hypothetical protein
MRLLTWLRSLFRHPQPPDWSRHWHLVALRYRRWFRSELAGNLFNKRRGDQATFKLWLVGRCVFCDRPFGELEEVIWIPAHRRGYCLPCRDSILAEEKDEADREARSGPYVTLGVPKKDFY